MGRSDDGATMTEAAVKEKQRVGRPARTVEDATDLAVERLRGFLVQRLTADPDGRSVKESEIRGMLHYFGMDAFRTAAIDRLVATGEIERSPAGQGKHAMVYIKMRRKPHAATTTKGGKG